MGVDVKGLVLGKMDVDTVLKAVAAFSGDPSTAAIRTRDDGPGDRSAVVSFLDFGDGRENPDGDGPIRREMHVFETTVDEDDPGPFEGHGGEILTVLAMGQSGRAGAILEDAVAVLGWGFVDYDPGDRIVEVGRRPSGPRP